MLLKWKGTGVWAIGTESLEGMTIALVPGPNTLKESDWEMIKNHPDVKKRLKSNQLEIISDKKEIDEESGEEKSDLAAMNSKDAIALVKETANTVELNKWKDAETRAGVIKAIDAQLEHVAEEIKKDGEEKKKKEEE